MDETLIKYYIPCAGKKKKTILIDIYENKLIFIFVNDKILELLNNKRFFCNFKITFLLIFTNGNSIKIHSTW